jgi:hypothetical protein
MEIAGLSLIVFLYVAPYVIMLFFKKLDLWIRLLFVSLIEICFWLFFMAISEGIKAYDLSTTLFFYNIGVWMIVGLNLVIIFLLILTKRLKQFFKRKRDGGSVSE